MKEDEMTPEQQLEHDRKQMKLMSALKNEVSEIIIRYTKARLDTTMLVGVLVSSAMKIENAVNAASMTTMSLMKSGAIDSLVQALKEYKESKDKEKSEDKE